MIAAGITVHEALKAYDKLKAEGINVRVIDAYSVKPIDQETLRRAAKDTGGKLVVVEDHWFEGGLGDAVLDAFTGDGWQTADGGEARRAQDARLRHPARTAARRRHRRRPHRSSRQGMDQIAQLSLTRSGMSHR